MRNRPSSAYTNCGTPRAQLQNRAFLVRDPSAKDHFWVRDRGRQIRDRSPPHTPADGHHWCFWLRHRSKRAQCARRHQASTPVQRAACCVDAFLSLVALVESVLRPGGWENMCRLMCHCVRHIGLDNKHGRSVEAIHSFLSRWTAGTGALCQQQEPSRTARRARWGARTVRGASRVT